MENIPQKIELPASKNAYFASDVHLGLFPYEASKKREQLFIQWLNEIKPTAGALFLVGDIFDFWYEYRKVIPKGHARFIGRSCRK